MNEDQTAIVAGTWKRVTHWSFHVSSTPPQGIKPSAAMGLVHWDNKVMLTHTKRGWELPGGHVEDGEDVEEALKRELLEEAGIVDIESCSLFGYKKIINTKEKINKATGVPYSPETCVLYYLVHTNTEPIERTDTTNCFDAKACDILDPLVHHSSERDMILIGHAIFLAGQNI